MNIKNGVIILLVELRDKKTITANLYKSDTNSYYFRLAMYDIFHPSKCKQRTPTPTKYIPR